MEVLARVENKVEGEKRGKDLVMILCIENAGKRKSKTWGNPTAQLFPSTQRRREDTGNSRSVSVGLSPDTKAPKMSQSTRITAKNLGEKGRNFLVVMTST